MTIQEIKDYLQALLDGIEADSRYQDEPAHVQINAPLALIQVELGAKANLLKHLLHEIETAPADPAPRIELPPVAVLLVQDVFSFVRGVSVWEDPANFGKWLDWYKAGQLWEKPATQRQNTPTAPGSYRPLLGCGLSQPGWHLSLGE